MVDKLIWNLLFHTYQKEDTESIKKEVKQAGDSLKKAVREISEARKGSSRG